MQNIWLKPFLSLIDKNVYQLQGDIFFFLSFVPQIRLNGANRSPQFKIHGALHYISYLGGKVV